MRTEGPNAEKLIKAFLNEPEETQFLEFKRVNGKGVVSKIIQTIIAFANTDGGEIILGIDDPEKTKLKGFDRVYGIEEDKESYDEIFREAKRIAPFILVRKLEVPFLDGGKTVVMLSVPKATNDLHSIDGHYYERLKKGNKELSAGEVINLRYARGFSRADSELVDVDFALLDTQYYASWRDNRGISGNIKEVLTKTGLAKKGKPTRAAVMLFAEYPTGLMDTKCAIKIMKYTSTIEQYGETPNMIGVPKIIDAPIIEQISKAQEYVLLMLSQGIEIHSGFVTKYLIPERAIKEAITNAVIHRDYYIKRDIEIKIFEDRIEIISPGLFPYNINKNNIGFVRSDGYRNDLIVKTLREFPSPPNLDQNEGVVAMRNEMKAEGLYPPVFRTYPETYNTVEVVLLNEHTPSEWEKVKEYLELNHYITNSEAREITGVVQTHTMSRLFAKWVNQGLLLRIDTDNGPKNIRYKLPYRKNDES